MAHVLSNSECPTVLGEPVFSSSYLPAQAVKSYGPTEGLSRPTPKFRHLDDLKQIVIVERANGEHWLLEYGVGCLGLWRYEGKQILVHSPELFAGVGSQIILPSTFGQTQSCRIWNSQWISGPAIQPIIPPPPAQPPPIPQTGGTTTTPSNHLAEPAPWDGAAFQIGLRSYATVRKGQLTIVEHAMDAAPFIEDSRTFVPVRYVAHAIGVSDVLWDAETMTVTIVDGDRFLRLTVDSTELVTHAGQVTMDVSPVIREGRTYLPARYVAEAFGWKVEWFPAVQGVILRRP